MEKTFNTFQELLDFDFSNLEPSKSNYLRFIPSNGILPSINNKFYPKKWRVINHPNKVEPQIVMEITPRWITITVHEPKISKRENFEFFKKDIKSFIEEIFEP